jgi:L-fucose isomerase-like protein
MEKLGENTGEFATRSIEPRLTLRRVLFASGVLVLLQIAQGTIVNDHLLATWLDA